MSINRRETAKGARYDVRLRDPNGKVYTRTFPTKKDAERFERSELTARDRGAWTDPRDRVRTFADVAAEWLDSNPGKRGSTISRDRMALDRHLLPHLGAKRLGAITPRDVQAVVTAMGAALAPSTVGRNYRVAAAVFRYATDRDYIAKSPCRTVKLPRVGRTDVHVFTPDELEALADALPARFSAMVWLGALLGLRWGETAALAVADVDLLGRRLHVRRTVTRDEKGRTVLGEPKSDAGRRSVAIPAPLVEILAAHLAALSLTAADPDALLFPSATGSPMSGSNFRRRVWGPAIVAAGLGTSDGDSFDGPTFHDLRRTSATGLVAEGVDPKTAQARLGHSQVRLTLELYAQAIDASDTDASDAIARRLLRPRDGRAMGTGTDGTGSGLHVV